MISWEAIGGCALVVIALFAVLLIIACKTAHERGRHQERELWQRRIAAAKARREETIARRRRDGAWAIEPPPRRVPLPPAWPRPGDFAPPSPAPRPVPAPGTEAISTRDDLSTTGWLETIEKRTDAWLARNIPDRGGS